MDIRHSRIPRLHSPWAAVCWLAGYLLDGGIDIRLPSILPSPTYSAEKPGIAAPFVGDEIAGEPAAMALRISLAMREAIGTGWVSDDGLRDILDGALLEVKRERRERAYNAAVSAVEASRMSNVECRMSNVECRQSDIPRPPKAMSEKERKALGRAARLAMELREVFSKWEVLGE